MSHPTHTPTVQSPTLRLGQQVHVNARASWLPATITSIAPVRVGVHYHIATPLTPLVAPWLIRPAAGIRLQPVHLLAVSDQVVAYDGAIHVICAPPWQGRDGWWVITLDNGETAVLPPRAVLRLTDPGGDDA
ncbi:hypothetical protein [Phytohabitans rumicis]|uniref:Uncharacterized protein n=1 Tax=Phytohabitans rumicis TaxID=1076125 RepID=A0A6V8LGX5_9ACTN|nr:hypothetical protein [Phytohabitans rumicis]GFJ93327.1 hypothetical protein Prum_069690 [Phytohabitans rumicis]